MGKTEYTNCCQTLVPGDSPFEVGMLGYYDGLTSGVARCRACGQHYYVDLLATDVGEHFTRLHLLREITEDDGERLFACLRASGAADAQRRELALQVWYALCSAEGAAWHPLLHVATDDLSKSVLAARRIGRETWMELLGIGEKPQR